MKMRPMTANCSRSSGRAVGVGPDVEEERQAPEGRDEQRQGGLVDAPERPQDLAADVDDGRRVAHADERVGRRAP